MVPDSSIHVEKRVNLKTECTYMFHEHEPITLKRYVLGINTHLNNNLKNRNVDWQKLWFTKYLKALKAARDEHVVKIDVHFRVVRQIATLDHRFFLEKLQEYQSTRSGWTHLVEQVVYGAEFICSIWKPVDLKVETRECSEGSLYLAAKTYFDDAIGSHWSTNKELPAALKNARCTIYNSLDSDNVLEGTFQISFTWLREAINREDLALQSMEILLRYVPENLEILHQRETLCDRQLENDRIEFRLHWIKEQSRILSAHPLLKRAPIFARPLERLLHLLEPLQNEFQKYTETHSPQEANNSISNLLTEVTDWLIVRRKQIEAIASLINESQFRVVEWDEIESCDIEQKLTKMFILKVDYVQDHLMAKINFLTKFYSEYGGVKLPVFPILSAEGESFKQIGRWLQNFTEEASLAGPMQETFYCIGLVSDQAALDGMVANIEYLGKGSNRKFGEFLFSSHFTQWFYIFVLILVLVLSHQQPGFNDKERPTVSSDGFEQKKKVGYYQIYTLSFWTNSSYIISLF